MATAHASRAAGSHCHSHAPNSPASHAARPPSPISQGNCCHLRRGRGTGGRAVRVEAGGVQGSDKLWEVLEGAAATATTTSATTTASPAAAASFQAGKDQIAMLAGTGGTPGAQGLDPLQGALQSVGSALRSFPSLTTGGRGPSSLVPADGQLSGTMHAVLEHLQEVVAQLSSELGPAIQPKVDGAMASLQALANGADSSLLGQGVETLFSETNSLRGPGVFDNGELVQSLSRGGVPHVVTEALAKLLDLEFDLAEDGAPGVVALILLAVSAVGIFSFTAAPKGTEEATRSGLAFEYDPAAAAAYFEERPVMVISRLLELVSRSAGFLAGVFMDRQSGDVHKNEELRAKQCVELLTELGPTFVKIGQALSIRVDLLAPVYIEELKTLQDRVPAFPTPTAKQIMADELAGGDLDKLSQIFRSIPNEPVAAASLGQVYRCQLRDQDIEVAVKVQRPDVLEGIQLDLYLLRLAAPVAKASNNLNSDLVGLVDEWGTRFVGELDYITEAANGKQFTAAMEARGITAVTAAEVVDEFTTPRVLTTRWVEGQRLEESYEADVSRLCGVALNAYLTMLLDTGTLHADPHPGNLLRTTDGRLCILDWGLVTPITTEQQYSLVDYISNLVSEDYSAIPRDLVALGFVPPGREDALEQAGVVRVLGNVLRQLSAGGGASKLDVAGLISELQEMTASYGNLFQIPPYFAYILRAFTVLEGVGLASDPDYAIVQECYPTLAQRLFVDDNPRTRAALRRLIQNADGELDVESIARLTTNFQRFTASTQGLDRSQTGRSDSAAQQMLDRELLSIVFADEPNFLQEVLLEEAAKAVDALSRDAFARLLGGIAAGPLGRILEQQRTVATALGALRPLLLPLPLPGEVLRSWAPLAQKTAEDEAQLELVRRLVEAARAQAPGADGQDQQPSRAELLQMVASSLERAAPLLPELAPGIAATAARLQAMLLRRAAHRLGDPRMEVFADRLIQMSTMLPKMVR